MKKYIIGLLSMILILSLTCSGVAAAEIDMESFFLMADFLITGEEEPYEIGPLVKRFDAKKITSPDITFEQLEQSCDEAAAAVYRSGEYDSIALFRLEDKAWVCYRMLDPDPNFLQQMEESHGEFLWPYNINGNAAIHTAHPHTVSYFNQIRWNDSPQELDFSVYLQCVSCEIERFSYLENRTLLGVYDSEDIAYAKEYWGDKNWFRELGTLPQVAIVVGSIVLLAFGIDRLLILREKKRRASK